MPSIRVTEDLELKPPKISDAHEIFSLVDRNREHLREFLGWVDHSNSAEDTAQFLKTELAKTSEGEALLFKILYKGKCVGLIGSNHMAQLDRRTEVGYWLDKGAQGQGIMTRSLQALINYYFNELKLHRIELRCALKNKKSIAIAERLGFQQEGLLKQSIKHYENYLDAYMYAIVNG